MCFFFLWVHTSTYIQQPDIASRPGVVAADDHPLTLPVSATKFDPACFGCTILSEK
jgi:hypothetical protein